MHPFVKSISDEVRKECTTQSDGVLPGNQYSTRTGSPRLSFYSASAWSFFQDSRLTNSRVHCFFHSVLPFTHQKSAWPKHIGSILGDGNAYGIEFSFYLV
ncbi:hypothetical protein OTU49_001835 [Cherax quadricarinatus]|uniref:Uncharacterized protein n=1 Tax=Cherax quadricarinatus TaxID=27406 RepID=A0AAW0XRE7_CHEQU